jgi:AraC family transcriptional regulator
MSEAPDCGLVRAAKLETFEIAEFVLTSESSLPEHAHDRPAIAIGLEGCCALVIAESATTTLAHGDLLTIPADLTHRETVPNGTSRCLLVSGGRSGSVAGDGVRHLNSLTIAELGGLLADALGGNDSLGAEATAHELHTLVRVGVANEAARARDPGWLAVVVEYLEDCFRSPPSLSDLSREAGVSREHIARVFRRETGLTVGQFVRLRRVLEGAMCLRQRAADLSEVALHCGYSDQSHFTREFRRFLGTTPHVHRQRFHGARGTHEPSSPKAHDGRAASAGGVTLSTSTDSRRFRMTRGQGRVQGMIGLFWAGMFSLACEAPADATSQGEGKLSDADSAAVAAADQAYADGWLEGGADPVMSTLHEDVVIIGSGMDAREGSDAVREFWFPANSPPTNVGHYELDQEEVGGSTEFAFVRGTFALAFEYDGESFESEGTYLTLLRPDETGEWRISHRTWNDHH